MGWREQTSWWRSREKIRGDAHGDTHDGAYHVHVDMTFRDAVAVEGHDSADREEFAERLALFEARVTALEMGSRDADA